MIMGESKLHEFYMRRCFELAKLGSKYTKKNPMVGAVITYDNKIIGEGYHKEYGKQHAEVNALNSVQEKDKALLKEATLYVSLEPCFHEGKTPPCVDAVLKNSIKKVVVSCLDPFEKVAGKSINKLKANGVDVTTGILEKQGRNLIRKFIANTIEKRPYVVLKFAQSYDGYIGKKDQAIWLTNKFSKTLTHKWRSEVDGIMVGTQTAVVDNPKLTNRLYTGDSPMRIILDRNKRIPDSTHVLSDSYPTLMFTQDPNYKLIPNKTVIHIPEWSLPTILQKLYEQDIYSLIVEGGKSLLQSFITEELWDEYRIFRTQKNLNSGIKAPLIQSKFFAQEVLDGDVLSYGYRK